MKKTKYFIIIFILVALSACLYGLYKIGYFSYVPRGGGSGDLVHYITKSSFKIDELATSYNSGFLCSLIDNQDCVHGPCPKKCMTNLALKKKY